MQTRTRLKIAIAELTAQNYEVPKGEEHLFHVLQEVKKWNVDTGKPINRPRVQKYGAKTFAIVREDLVKQGYTLTVLHNPNEYALKKHQENETNAAQRAEEKRIADEEKAKADKEAADKAQQDAIDAAVAKALGGVQDKIDQGIAAGLKAQQSKAAKTTASTSKEAADKAATKADNKQETGAADQKGTENK